MSRIAPIRWVMASALAAWPGLCLPAAWQMDFEDKTRIQDAPERQSARIVPPRPWAAAGDIGIQYEGGDLSQRAARIVTDPAGGPNRVLEFEVLEPNVRIARRDGFKSRIQLNMYRLDGASEVYASVRLRLDGAMRALVGGPRFDWLTVSEWWNNAGWTGEPYPFRISVNLTNAGGGDGLGLVVHASAKPDGGDQWSRTFWTRDAGSFRLPFDTWVRLEYYFRQGGPRAGRFAIAATPDGKPRQVVLDVTDSTHHPDDPQPDGLSHVNPIKLYTSRQVTEHVRASGGSLRIWWDDLEVLTCVPAAPQATACASRFPFR